MKYLIVILKKVNQFCLMVSSIIDSTTNVKVTCKMNFNDEQKFQRYIKRTSIQG